MQNAKTKVVTDFLQNSVFFFNSLFHDQVQLWSLPTSLSASSNFHVKIYPPNSCTLFLRCIQYSLLSLVWMYFSKALIANFTQSPMNFKLPLSFLGTYDRYTSELFQRLCSTNFPWSIIEYFARYVVNNFLVFLYTLQLALSPTNKCY